MFSLRTALGLSLISSFKTGSIENRDRSGRPITTISEKVEEIAEVEANASFNTVRRVSRGIDVSKSVVHRVMRGILGFEPYKMHLTQQLYNEDKDLRVEMAELLLPIPTTAV